MSLSTGLGLAQLVSFTSLLVCHSVVEWLEIIFVCVLLSAPTDVTMVAVCLMFKVYLYVSGDVSILSC